MSYLNIAKANQANADKAAALDKMQADMQAQRAYDAGGMQVRQDVENAVRQKQLEQESWLDQAFNGVSSFIDTVGDYATRVWEGPNASAIREQGTPAPRVPVQPAAPTSNLLRKDITADLQRRIQERAGNR